jgi:protein-S-isoprenylcysteine O-methyltransferase Ste14
VAICRVVAAAAGLIGSVSLLLFGAFLVRGPIAGVDLGLGTSGALAVDGALCLGFFLQHSVMIRASFKRRMSGAIPQRYHGAVYAIASGVVLIVLVVLWQEIPATFLSLNGVPRLVLRALIPAAVVIFVWGVRSLESFDTFGLSPLWAGGGDRSPDTMPLTVRGAYRMVRHPLYLSMLMVVWAYPVLSYDRLLFNVSWTVWVVFATRLEERDLVTAFGDPYREYQSRVPMLLPWRGINRGA